MNTTERVFSNQKVSYYFDASLRQLSSYADPERTVLIVDDRVEALHGHQLPGWRRIVVKGSEESKSISGFQQVVDQLIAMEADRKTLLVGIGGGVVTDLTGMVASLYMRGIAYGFVPTTLLAQVDAAIGGKNGINYGRYKNILGVIRQPRFLLFDYSLLQTLGDTDLSNGFAEVIKYACICDASLFTFLEEKREKALQKDPEVLGSVIRRSAGIKSDIVEKDEFEGGLRRLLNFGHTIGHAVEKLEQIPHGQAVAKGMVIAARFSVVRSGFPAAAVDRLISLIQAYHLPVAIQSAPSAIESLFRMDKKRENDSIHFILLEQIGRADIQTIPLVELSALLKENIS